MRKKVNCWEYRSCGREPGGGRVKDLGLCPAATCASAHGINGGMKGGRMCWAIAGIYALGDAAASKCRMHYLCYDCEFHKNVLSEEGIVKPELLERK